MTSTITTTKLLKDDDNVTQGKMWFCFERQKAYLLL